VLRKKRGSSGLRRSRPAVDIYGFRNMISVVHILKNGWLAIQLPYTHVQELNMWLDNWFT
jgi:hypothetical protein